MKFVEFERTPEAEIYSLRLGSGNRLGPRLDKAFAVDRFRHTGRSLRNSCTP